jgi:predicted dehydrogenase
MNKTKIGIIGCGNISDAYFRGGKELCAQYLDIVACADVVPERAKEKAEKWGIARACTTDELLADPEIELVVNLTVPKLHAEVNLQAVEAGKHVYVEKPFAMSLDDADRVIAAAAEHNVRLGCAPDTFLGAGIQTCRAIIDKGLIGTPISAFAFMLCHGHESWHPDPEFYYQQGGGPMLDMGPYYITALVNLISPIKRTTGFTGKAFAERTITSQKKHGTKVPVETATHVAGSLDFASGAIGTIVMSFDVWRSTQPCIEIHGTEGSLSVPDPNCFNGPIRLYRPGESDWQEIPIDKYGYAENARGIGVADMAQAIRTGRPHRASAQLATHVLDVMLSFDTCAETGCTYTVTRQCEKPAAFRPGMQPGEVD